MIASMLTTAHRVSRRKPLLPIAREMPLWYLLHLSRTLEGIRGINTPERSMCPELLA